MSSSSSDVNRQLKIQELQGINAQLADLFVKAEDIHLYTRPIGQHYQTFYETDQDYHLSSTTQSLDTVIEEILSWCSEAQKANVTTVLNSIRATTTPDDETGINLPDLLIRTWSLVKKPGIYDNAVGLVIDNLDHNIAAGGGCLPGIAARLVQPYANFVLHMLQPTHSVTAQPSQDNELELAIALSLSAAQPQPRRQEKEDSVLQLALYHSRLEQQKTEALKRAQEEQELNDVLERSKTEQKAPQTQNSEDYELQLALTLVKSMTYK